MFHQQCYRHTLYKPEFSPTWPCVQPRTKEWHMCSQMNGNISKPHWSFLYQDLMVSLISVCSFRMQMLRLVLWSLILSNIEGEKIETGLFSCDSRLNWYSSLLIWCFLLFKTKPQSFSRLPSDTVCPLSLARSQRSLQMLPSLAKWRQSICSK